MEGDENRMASKKSSKRTYLSSFKGAIAAFKVKQETKKGARVSHTKPRKSDGKTKRGAIYISHLPHGFYENQIAAYFTQFGIVTGVKLPRSKRTGRSRGFGFVQFLDRDVAEIAAKTMQNYLMVNRIIFAELVSPKKQKNIKFASLNNPIITSETCTTAKNRNKFIAMRNATQSELKEQQMIQQEKWKLERIQKKLAGLGIPELEV